jgi:multidrug efflux pump
MVITEIFIKRPIFTSVLSLLVLLIGIISFTKLTVREYPNIDPPVINVTTTYNDANSNIVESQVTTILEEALAGTEGIDVISSVSTQGSSEITLTFNLATNLETAANDVRDKVSRTMDLLPQGIDPPVIAKVAADADPIIYLSLYSDELSSLEISNYGDLYIKDKLQTIKGVASVNLLAERKYSMRIWPTSNMLAAYNLTIQDIETALRSQNVELPGGIIEGVAKEFTVLVKSDLNTVEEFENIVLKNKTGQLVRLRDVATVELAAENERVIARFNGKNTIGIGIVKQAGANPLEISNAVREKLIEIRKTIPKSLSIDVAYDVSLFIKQSIDAVYKTFIESIVLVILIIFVFLRSYRSTLVPLVTIPISLIGTFTFILLLGFSINTLTLLALILAIGLVVDDAIVMMENIYRYIEQGYTPVEAALKGSKEISFAIISMTITLASVFLPIAFMGGRTGKIFTEFAWTLAIAVIISGFVALTLSPMMSSKALRLEHHNNSLYHTIGNFLDKINFYYRHALMKAIETKKLVLIALAVVSLIGAIIFFKLPSELAPTEDRGVMLVIYFGPEGSSLEYTNQYAKQLEAIYETIPEIKGYFSAVGWPIVSKGLSFIMLKPEQLRQRSAFQIVQELAPKLGSVPGLIAFPIMPPSLGEGGMQQPIEVMLESHLEFPQIQEIVEKFLGEMRASKEFTNLDTNLVLNQPRVELEIDRDKASMLGIDIKSVGDTIATLVGSRNVTYFKKGNKQYKVIIRLKAEERVQPEDLNNIYLRSLTSNKMIALSNVATIKETLAPRELSHYNRVRAVKISSALTSPHTIGDAIPVIEKIAQKVVPNTAGAIEFAGLSRDFLQSSSEIYFIFIMALIFIYLVLAAQFESFIDPLIILFTVPLSITGAVIALYLSHGTLNIYSKIGLVTLIGLITKNGILIIEFTNQLLEQGRSLQAAVVEAATIRLRPILMTTMATILGAIPLALAHGPGSASRNAIGWVIVGGLLIGTIFTLFVIPVICLLVKKERSLSNN